MPASFRFPQRDEVDLLIPYALSAANDDGGAHFLRVLGRLRPGVAFESAFAELRALARTLEAETNGGPNRDWTVNARPLHDAVVGDVRDTLIRLQGACLLVLLIAAVNIANLLIVRAAARSREMAVRAALGAGAARLARQLLTESALLAVLGGAAGLALAWLLLQAAPQWLPASLPRAGDLAMNPTVVGFALGIALAAGLLAGVAPAFGPSARANILAHLGASRGAISARGFQLRRLLVGLQLALA